MDVMAKETKLRSSLGTHIGKKKQVIGNNIYIAAIIAITFLVYYPIFSHTFQFGWDDQWVVINDYTEGGVNLENIRAILTEFYHGQYSPVNEFYYLLLYQSFGYNPFWFHFANLLVHVSNIMLVFFFIKKILSLSGNFTTQSVLRISGIVSLLFAFHPLMVEPVSWMAASKCMIFASFYLLALSAYLDFITTSRTWSYLKVMLYFLLAFGAKEVAVTLPVCLLLLDFMQKRDLLSAKIWFEKLPYFCLSFVFILVTFYSQAYNREGILSEREYYPIYQNVVFAAYTIIEYVIKTVLPIRLSYLYPFPNQQGEPLPVYMYLYPVILIVNFFAFKKYLKNKWILFGIAFYLIQISAASNIIPTSRFAILADRYMYLPIIGILFILAYGFDCLLIHRKRLSFLLTFCGFTYIIALSVYSHQRSKVWKNSVSLKKELKESIRSRSDFKTLENQLK